MTKNTLAAHLAVDEFWDDFVTLDVIGITGIFSYIQFWGTNLPQLYGYEGKAQCTDRVKISLF